MGKRDCRPVLMEVFAAFAAVHWIRTSAIPKTLMRSPTLLGCYSAKDDAKRLEKIANLLVRKVNRKRSSQVFSALIEVEDAAAFSRAIELCRPAWPLQYSSAMLQFAKAMNGGGQLKTRGRKALTSEQVIHKAEGYEALEQRHRKRLVARYRRNKVWSHWFQSVTEGQETILTTELALPKI